MKKRLLIAVLIMSITALGEDKTAAPLPTSGNVTLPLDEYNRLVELASRPVKAPETPPLPYVLKCADLKFRVQNESVEGTVHLEGEVFKKGLTKVPLATGVTILDAHQEGKALPLEYENGTQTTVLSGPSEFAVTLDTGLQLGIGAGRASFSFPVPPAGSARLMLAIPGDHTNVRISPGLITGRTTVNGQTAIEATLVPGQPVNVWWTTREIATPVAPRELRFLSDVKTLMTVSEADLRIAALADINVLQGEPAEFRLEIPAGYEFTGASGASLESSEIQDGILVLKVNSPAQRNHQFLISMERPVSGTKTAAPFLSFKAAQRETGEVLVEGAGTMELTATEGGGLKRMDLKEINPYLRSLSRFSLQAAFRYHRQPTEVPTLGLEWVRFPDSSVLAAVAERAEVTTLVTSEGRSLTEVKLVLKNQAQPFLKVELPTGASILSAEVAGEKVKPVLGTDGARVALLRSGFRPIGSYEVSFVFMHSGTPFARKGGSELDLPKMDIPINLLQWEIFLPEQYKVKDFGGDALATGLLQAAGLALLSRDEGDQALDTEATNNAGNANKDFLLPGQLTGTLVDPNGAVIANARVTVRTEHGSTLNVVTDQAGFWSVSNVPSGKVKITADAPGFRPSVLNGEYDANRPTTYNSTLNVGAAMETVEVTSGPAEEPKQGDRRERQYDKAQQLAQLNAPSSNVINLQKRVAGVLPVRVDVPRAGNSFRFVRPLVLDEVTKVTFSYKTK
ncbi:MAG TPA: carboxypeptidase-like regulatory domain-containing protein [Candidatus Angelobacter sp.]|nr:carboxypeptidase-like regulatory domain-containing protein [Candidatus Angelobacter sp.]